MYDTQLYKLFIQVKGSEIYLYILYIRQQLNLFVRVNTLISETIGAKATKFIENVSNYCTQTKLITETCHAHFRVQIGLCKE